MVFETMDSTLLIGNVIESIESRAEDFKTIRRTNLAFRVALFRQILLLLEEFFKSFWPL